VSEPDDLSTTVDNHEDSRNFRRLQALTGIDFRELAKCVFFYRRFPNKDYPIQPWRELRSPLSLPANIPLPLPPGTFDLIVMDPPWPYGTHYDKDRWRGGSPYPEMSIEELRSLQIPASDDSVLWLWTTNAFMHEAYHLLEAWGFEPKTILTWVKDKMGLGVWLRGITEHCILAAKGSPDIKLTNETTVLYGERREHSRKPEEFYRLLQELCPAKRRLDMFSREKREGWEQYGDEPERFANATIGVSK
jgi:N6-adenosine-specific RNA methylase IME4